MFLEGNTQKNWLIGALTDQLCYLFGINVPDFLKDKSYQHWDKITTLSCVQTHSQGPLMLDPGVTERKKVLTLFHCIGMRAPKSNWKWSDILRWRTLQCQQCATNPGLNPLQPNPSSGALSTTQPEHYYYSFFLINFIFQKANTYLINPHQCFSAECLCPCGWSIFGAGQFIYTYLWTKRTALWKRTISSLVTIRMCNVARNNAVVSLGGRNCRLWSHLKSSRQKANIFTHKGIA